MKPFPLSTNRKAITTVRGQKPLSKGPKPKNLSSKAATPPIVKTTSAPAKKRKKTMTRPLPPYDDEDDAEEEVEVTKAVLEEEDEEKETGDHPGKRKKAQKLVYKQPKNFEAMKKHYRLAAHQCIHFTNAWVTTQATLLHGFKLRGILESLDNDGDNNGDDDKDKDKEEADEDKETPDNFVGMDVYNTLVTSIFPNIEQNIQWLEGQADPEDPLQFIFELLSSINAGTRSGRTDDTSKINDNIICYSTTSISDDTPVLDIKKYRRGFNHIHTAHLLCPQRWINDFDKDPQAMMVDLPTKVTPRYLPSFLYDQTLADVNDPR
ncbi:uncharacterized protein ARMOST_02524 [Armillaria ostoyae]|uniref:Uncharacterized protein n=1 Tax=Armillaria ostoyae TaxID=47428 RepID=A0A284QS46_ARMOS|nr:uncharacterized protein ARMOST_02524 [Armillaria ostoyae]